MISAKAKIGEGTFLSAPELVFIGDCQIGKQCKIHAFVTIQDGVTIGNFCKIQHYAFIPPGVIIEDGVFIGQGVCFTNDKYPRATTGGKLQTASDWKLIPTRVKKGASIGSNSTIICGVTIGEKAMVGAGSVVTHDIAPETVVIGNPAKVKGQIKDA